MAIDRLPAPDRVLVVAAHPDDIEFGAAGTVARWVDGGSEVRYLLVTRGDKGSDDPSVDSAELATRREREQRSAAAEIGATGVDFLDRKIAALRCHESQFPNFAETERWLRRTAEELGERAGYRAAEGFRRVMLAR